MGNMQSNTGKFSGRYLVRDANGRPKMATAKVALKFWDSLSDEDKVYLNKKFNLGKEK